MSLATAWKWISRALLSASTALGTYAAGMTVFGWPKPTWTWLAFLLDFPLWIWLVTVLVILLAVTGIQNRRLKRQVAILTDTDGIAGPILVGPPMPDMTLKDVVSQIRDYLFAQGVAEDEITGQRVNTEFADGLSLHSPSVWGRYEGTGALDSLGQWNLSSATLNIAQNQIRVASEWTTVTYTDLRFNRSEIDQIWPLPA